MAALHLPDYRGSAQSALYALPVPYFVYRGDFFKADRHGVRGMFFETDRVDLNLSVGASLPVDSDESQAREGMPDLEPSVELGPSLDVTLWRSADRARQAGPAPAAARRDHGRIRPALHRRAVLPAPEPRRDRRPAGFPGWNLGVLAGPVFTDRRYNRYFYDVRAGVRDGHAPRLRARRRLRRHAVPRGAVEALPAVLGRAASLRYDTLAGATFADSPLVTSKRYLAGGIGFSWIFAESSRRVPVDD